MKRYLTILSLAAAVMLASGCDFFRTLAGRPTSAEIAAKRLYIEQMESRKAEEAEALQDTLALEITEEIAEETETEVPSGIRYYVIAGAFSTRSNAESVAAKLDAAGVNSELIEYRNGMTAVGVGPAGTQEAAKASLQDLVQKGLVPADSWIMERH